MDGMRTCRKNKRTYGGSWRQGKDGKEYTGNKNPRSNGYRMGEKTPSSSIIQSFRIGTPRGFINLKIWREVE